MHGGRAVSSSEATDVPLIDGTYEILRQQALSETETLVLATDPDGRPVRIVLYEVAPEHESSFERHRRALRRLGREGDVLLRDVVSRPGAHFAVWEDASDAPPAEPEGAWGDRLAALGLDPRNADLRRDGRTPRLAGLRWDPAASATGPRGAFANGDGAPSDPFGRPSGPTRGEGGRSWPTPDWWPQLRFTPRTRTYLVSALLALTATALALVGWERGDNDAVVVIPELAGTPAQDAADLLADLGLAVAPQARANGEAAGSVLTTVPPAGTALRPGREVQLLYALPPNGMATHEVPNLVGRSMDDDLSARLAEAGLGLASVARVPAALPADTVLAQRPAAGARLGQGGGVSLLISDGPRPATTFLPDLVGLSEEDARALALVAGLPAERVLVDTVAASEGEPGTVLAMTPAPWHAVRVDDVALRLLVSAASSGTAVVDPDDGAAATPRGATPDFVGLASADALNSARDEGLAPSVARMSDPRLPPGVVLQDPAPGAEATGSVRLVVNVRPVPLPVPEPEVHVLAPALRDVPYRIPIEPGIPSQTAEVRAVTAEGTTVLVHRGRTSGGSVVEGSWLTTVPGPVRFEVYLNDVFYAEVRVSP